MDSAAVCSAHEGKCYVVFTVPNQFQQHFKSRKHFERSIGTSDLRDSNRLVDTFVDYLQADLMSSHTFRELSFRFRIVPHPHLETCLNARRDPNIYKRPLSGCKLF